MKSHYSIKAIIRKDKARADGKTPICIQVIIKHSIYRWYINEYVTEKFWNQTDGKVKKGYTNYSDINSIIELEISNLKKYLVKIELAGNFPTIDDVKQFCNPKLINPTDLFLFWEIQVPNWKSTKENSTIKNYNVTYNRLKDFTKGRKILLADVTLDFIERFDLYLKTIRGNTLSGANTRHKCLKTILKAAIAKELLDKNPYASFPLKKVEGRKIFLTIEELKFLENFDLKDDGNLGLVRDMYVFSCYTGLRISDVTNLKWINIEGELIKIQVIKTKKAFKTALINKSFSIISRYRGVTTDTVFPKLSHQKINKNLKKIAKKLSIKKDISFHTARHTFASLLNQKNINVLHIKELLGHENINVTMNYIHSIENAKFEHLSSLDNI